MASDSDLAEVVARALYNALTVRPADDWWPQASEAWKAMCRTQAEATLAALSSVGALMPDGGEAAIRKDERAKASEALRRAAITAENRAAGEESEDALAVIVGAVEALRYMAVKLDEADEDQADELDRVKRITTIALHRAIAGDWATAAKYIERLNGTAGVIVAIKLLADTYIGHIWPDHRLGDPIRIAWSWMGEGSQPGGDQAQSADEVRPSVRWGGRIIAARAAGDWDAFVALLKAPAQGAELGNGILALLDIVATSTTHADEIRARSTEVSRG